MGLCWFAEFISVILADQGPEEVWYFFDLINLSQGVFIFIVYVCKKSTLKIIKKRLGIARDIGSESNATLSTTDDVKKNSLSMSNMKSSAKT